VTLTGITTLSTQGECVTLMGISGAWTVIDRRIPSFWQTHTPSDTTLGWMTGGTRAYKWKRIGDSVLVKGYIINVGTVSTTIAFDPAEYLPPGLSADTAKILGANPEGSWYAYDESAASGADEACGTSFLTSTGVAQFLMGTIAGDKLNATVPFTWAANDEFGFQISCPISGWGG
jgi:hypothetical protein